MTYLCLDCERELLKPGETEVNRCACAEDVAFWEYVDADVMADGEEITYLKPLRHIPGHVAAPK